MHVDLLHFVRAYLTMFVQYPNKADRFDLACFRRIFPSKGLLPIRDFVIHFSITDFRVSWHSSCSIESRGRHYENHKDYRMSRSLRWAGVPL